MEMVKKEAESPEITKDRSPRMRKDDLVRRISHDTGLRLSDIESVFRSYSEIMAEQLNPETSLSVPLPWVGLFRLTEFKPRKFYDFTSSDIHSIKGGHKLSFRPLKPFKPSRDKG